MTRRRITLPSCSCGNVEDLLIFDDGELVCQPCCECPHGYLIYPRQSTPCIHCLRDYYTVWALTGPLISDFDNYVNEGQQYGFWPYELETWDWEEAERALKIRYRKMPRDRGLPLLVHRRPPRGPSLRQAVVRSELALRARC